MVERRALGHAAVAVPEGVRSRRGVVPVWSQQHRPSEARLRFSVVVIQAVFNGSSGVVVNTASGATALAYEGAPMTSFAPVPNEALHPAQEQHGVADMVLVTTIGGVVVCHVVKRARWGCVIHPL